MKRNIKQTLLAPAVLLLATLLGTASCTQDNEEPGGSVLPEGKITLVPTVAPTLSWSTADTDAPGTRADASVPVTLKGGELRVILSMVAGSGEPGGVLGCNYYSVSADGKLTRLTFADRQDETEAPLGVDAPGEYFMVCDGPVILETDGITYDSYLATWSPSGMKMTIGADGKLNLPLEIMTGGLRLNVKSNDGSAYTGADVTATLKNSNIQFYPEMTAALDTKPLTLTAAAPIGIWGNLAGSSNVKAGEQVMQLVTGGKTYRVNAPRQISFSRARLYTFNVRVGATGITVSSDDLTVGDFVVQAVTDAEAEMVPPVPLYNGKTPISLAVPGGTPYWVAPEDAASISWTDMMAKINTVCPEGWHVPTKDEFMAMTGITTTSSVGDNYDAIKAAFPAGGFYWSSTEYDTSFAWRLYIISDDSKSDISGSYKGDSRQVRCVRAK